MKAFLELIADKILQNPCYQTDKSIIVFPNRRAGLFLRKYLKTSDKTFFMPQIMGMDDFVSQTSGMSIVKNEFLLFELFRIHKEISQKNNNDKYQTFEEFIPFADMILKDFSDIDLHLVNAKQLFTNLFNEKQIGEWNISNPSQLTDLQQKYLAFYQSLYNYYTMLQERLKAANKAYSAMLYRTVAENIDSYADSLNWKKIMFVGFCEISQSERTIIETLKRRGIAEFETDGDKYYYSNRHEAGLMLRNNEDLWKTDDYELPEHFGSNKKHFTIISCPENTLQSECVGNLLKEQVEKQENIEDTVIVLADENLLIPVLNSLPNNIGKINITMGFPYTYTLTHNLLLSFLEMYEKQEKEEYNAKQIIQFLSHSMMEKNLGINNLQNKLTEIFAKEKIFCISGSALLKTIPEIAENGFAFLFPDKKLLPEELIETYKTLAIKTYPNCNTFREQISMALSYEIFDHFTELQQKYQFAENINVLRKIYQRIASCVRLSFKGEPLEGLQIMGLQETKNIDFKNIILVSCNEGVIPKGNSHNSLIPYDLRKGFGMFTYRERDAAEAYNFYRLLQRAENVHFIYQTDVEGGGKGEPSRFLTQLKKELTKQFPNISLKEKNITIESVADNAPLNLIKEKNETVMRILANNAKTGDGFSASSLNSYRECTLKYYYETILGIKNTAELEEDMDNSELGTHVHKILQNIFEQFLQKDIAPDKLPQGAELEGIVDKYFDENVFLNKRKKSGENYFMLSVAKKQIDSFIQQQIEFLKNHKSKIVCLEKNLEHNLLVNNDLQVKLHGVADRIEYIDEMLCVGDYKTGRVDEKHLEITEDFYNEEKPFDDEKIKNKWFQLMYYAWLYSKNHNIEKLETCIFPLQDLSKFSIKASVKNNGTMFNKTRLDRFEEYLKTLLSELFNADIPFEKSNKSNSCQYCSFANLCDRPKRKF